jgi:prepilin-type N-terminal cleavage/methylation domain-containing protein
MKNQNQSGFSLIELLIVIVIIGIIASIAFPYLIKARYASENAAMYATLRTISSAQIGFYTQNSRYATLSELNAVYENAYGTTVGNNIRRGSFTLDMGDIESDDPQLRADFIITATKTINPSDLPYIISVNSSGRIVQITP